MTTRRKFITSASLLTLGAATAHATPAPGLPALAHHVFFWLKNPGSKTDRDQLIQGLRELEKIETVRALHIGLPADTTQRPVIDSSYDVSELIFFDDVAGQDAYQVHPIHTQFVEKYSHLWSRVVVYDSVAI